MEVLNIQFPFCTSHNLQALDEFVRKTFNEWTSTVDKDATRLLEIPLMRRSLDRSGTLDLNFDRLLHRTILSFHFFIQLITHCVLILLGQKWFCSLSWVLEGYRIFVFYYRTLLKLFNEIHYWEKLMFETPHYVSELYMKKEDLRILRENVLLVVRDYNRLVLKQYMSLYCHGWHRLLRKKKKTVWV